MIKTALVKKIVTLALMDRMGSSVVQDDINKTIFIDSSDRISGDFYMVWR